MSAHYLQCLFILGASCHLHGAGSKEDSHHILSADATSMAILNKGLVRREMNHSQKHDVEIHPLLSRDMGKVDDESQKKETENEADKLSLDELEDAIAARTQDHSTDGADGRASDEWNPFTRRRRRRKHHRYYWSPPSARTSDGCKRYDEEGYGGKCYKKCSSFNFQGESNNGGYYLRVGFNACAKPSCADAEAEWYQGECYKKCVDFSSTYTIRVGADRCRSSDGKDNDDQLYNSGPTSGSDRVPPIDVTDVFGEEDDCTGYNINGDPEKREEHDWSICPYDQTK